MSVDEHRRFAIERLDERAYVEWSDYEAVSEVAAMVIAEGGYSGTLAEAVEYLLAAMWLRPRFPNDDGLDGAARSRAAALLRDYAPVVTREGSKAVIEFVARRRPVDGRSRLEAAK